MLFNYVMRIICLIFLKVIGLCYVCFVKYILISVLEVFLYVFNIYLCKCIFVSCVFNNCYMYYLLFKVI